MKHNKPHLSVIVSLLLVASTLLPAWQAAPQLAAPGRAQAAGSPAQQPLPPQVIQTVPAPGEEQPIDAALQVTFDQPMDANSVHAAFSIEPAVTGNIEWLLPTVMRFIPQPAFERATQYTLTIKQGAKSQAGLALKDTFELRFQTVGYLEVSAVQPAAGTEGVAADAVVTVLFNRPVVPLTAIEDQSKLPQPLTFLPPVTGKGEWLNTSIYRFTAAPGFEPATTYKARLSAANLTDTTGGVLAEDYTWEFTTVMPGVVATLPISHGMYVSTQPVIQVAFNQPMNRPKTEAAFQLVEDATGKAVTGTFQWANEGLAQPTGRPYESYSEAWSRGEGPARVGVETMSFAPSRALKFGTDYRATVPAGTPGAKGNTGTAQDVAWTFTTIEYPSIVSTTPSDGENAADPGGGLRVVFSSPMDPDSINGNFTIQPPISPTQVYTYWWGSNRTLQISFDSKASSDYQVTLSGNMRGRYGQRLGEDTTISWHTRARDPMLYLYAPYRIGTYLAYTPTVAYVNVRNVSKVEFSLFRMPLNDFLQANGKNYWDYWDGYTGDQKNLIRRWTLPVSPALNENLVYSTNLSGKKGGMLPPGLYYLEAQIPSDGVYPEAEGYGYLGVEKQMFVVSNVNLSLKTTGTDTLVWATDLRSGGVVPNLPIQVVDESGTILSQGQTNPDGVFVGKRPGVANTHYEPVFAFVGSRAATGKNFAITSNQWNDGISPWDFDNVPVESTAGPEVNAYFITDRTIYRPGQAVYFKAIVRNDDDAHYSLPGADNTVAVSISDAQGTKVYEQDLTLNEMGTLNGELQLGEEASLGSYSIDAHYRDQEFWASFQVAEYRKPEFQVAVETDKPEYVQTDKINLSAVATYYFGGPVANAAVQYTVMSADYAFKYQGKGWWDFTDYDFTRGYASYGSYGEQIAQGTGTTDAQGRFTLSLDADVAKYTASQLFTLEVSVTDINNQQVSNRTEAIVHKGLYYIGLQPAEYVGQVGKDNLVNVISVDWKSDPSPNRSLTVVFSEHNWYSVRRQAEDGSYYWDSGVEDVPVFTTTVTTDAKGAGSAAFTPQTGGIFKITATGTDEKGNEVRSSTYMWVSGSKYVNWRQENNDRIDLVADQHQYKVGDTATILIPHPYQGPVKALITIERGHIYRNWVQTLATNSEQIQIPITADLIPNVFVSVLIVKGQDETNPLPSFKLGYVQLPIDTTEKELTITLKPDKPAGQHYQPGETVSYQVQATDSQGRPAQADIALSLVDLSVLSLTDEPPDIVSTFWRERGLAVQTATGLTLSVDRVNLAVSPQAKGGGGGGGEFGVVRRQFPDTAYWNPSVRTDAQGQATVKVTLPDNLTTWRLSSWGVTADTLVGQSKVDVISSKDLLVRPVAPRFFVVGDQAELAAVINNNTDQPLDTAVALQADGLHLLGADRQQVAIPARATAKVTWPVTVDSVSQVTLRFGAKAGGLTDAVEIPVPVYRYSTPEVVATAGTLDADGQRLEGVGLPASYDPTQGELTVQIDPSLAAGTVEGLKYLEHYPYECTEQTVSRFLPNVVTYRAFKQLKLDRPDLETALPGLVGVGLQRLYNQQHYDGGWGWWTTDKSDPYLTAYVLLGMVEAKQAGFVVDDSVMTRAGDYLVDSLQLPMDIQEHWQANRQAFILYVLAEAERGDLGRTVALFDRRPVLDTFGKAYLAMALRLLEPDEPARVNTLLSDITSAAIVSATGAHWEESQVDYYAMNTDTRSTAIVVDALARLDPSSALAPNAVRWLMSARKQGYWETTQETAWSILGLTDWMVATGELQGAYTWQVAVNDQSLGQGSVTRANINETNQLQIAVGKLLADQANRVLIERTAPEGQAAGTGRLYYSLYLRYFKPAAEVMALNRGIIVSRQYSLESCDDATQTCRAIDQAKVDDVIRVRLTIIAPNDLHNVVVEDPFPAGAEGVDQSLKTTSVAGEQPELTRTDQRNPWSGEYGWWWFSHSEMRDEKAVLFAAYLPAGTYEYTYLIRASLPGKYAVIPTRAYEMYFPETFGRGDGGVFTITQ